MIEHKEEYGADIDGNRGTWVWESDLTDDDTEDVVRELKESMPLDFKELIDVVIVGQAAEYTHEVRPCDWMTLKEYNEMMKEFNDDY